MLSLSLSYYELSVIGNTHGCNSSSKCVANKNITLFLSLSLSLSISHCLQRISQQVVIGSCSSTLLHHLIQDKLIDRLDRMVSFFHFSGIQTNAKMFVKPLVICCIIFLLYLELNFAKLYRQIIGIPMGTTYAPLDADLFLFCYERDFMKSLSRENQTDIIESFISTSRYSDT